MKDFLLTAARILRMEVVSDEGNVVYLKLPSTLRRHFGTQDLFVTTDKNAALLDNDLRLLSPNSALTILLARLIRERGMSCHRGRLKLGTTPQDILESAQALGLVEGAALRLNDEEDRLFLRVVYRVRFVREQVQERLLSCCVDYETATARAAADLNLIKHLVAPLPPVALQPAHVSTALIAARQWLEYALYPHKVDHEVELSEMLQREQSRINTFYDSLEKDSELALGLSSDITKKGTAAAVASLKDERKRLLQEQEQRLRLTMQVEVVSMATLQSPVVTLRVEGTSSTLRYSPIYSPSLIAAACHACGREVAVKWVSERLLCSVCQSALTGAV
jgi:hypothetical protein